MVITDGSQVSPISESSIVYFLTIIFLKLFVFLGIKYRSQYLTSSEFGTAK
jgi:hypothetical protein